MSLKSTSILIANDHDDNRELLFIVLSGAGYSVREARNGSECLAQALDHPPDLIVMDIQLPHVSGLELIATLKAAKISYAEDPSNRDPRFARPRLRELMPQLAAEGGGVGRHPGRR